MPAESRQTVHLIDGADDTALDVSMRTGDIEDGRVVELAMDTRVYATLDEVEEFAELLTDFVEHHRAKVPEDPEDGED